MKAQPDSARSWAVALAGFVINFLLSGISRSTGLIYVALIESYGISRMEANLPFTLRSIIRNLLGPLVGVIGQKYGTQEITIIGGLFAFVGITSCSFDTNMMWISFFWGGIYGIGVALGNTLFQVIVNQHFEKHRATASGLSFSGACAGSFVFPVLIEYLLANVGLSGTFLLIGGLMLHVVPAALLMKEPPWIEKKSKKTCQKNIEFESQACDKKIPKTRNAEEKKGKSAEIFAIAYRKLPSNHDIFSIGRHNGILKNEVIPTDDSYNYPIEGKFVAENTVESSKAHNPTFSSTEKGTSMYQDIICMICDPMFHVISFSLAALVLVFDICITIIVDYVIDKGIPESDGKYFILMISVGDSVGRLAFGWVTDRNYFSLSKYMMLLQIIQGCIGLMPLFYSYGMLMAVVVFCSMGSGASAVMYPILVSKYLPSVQSLAIGWITFTGGIIAFGVPPLIGYFRDTVGSYDNLYLVIGAFSTMTGLLWGLEPLFVKMKLKTFTSSEIKFTNQSIKQQNMKFKEDI